MTPASFEGQRTGSELRPLCELVLSFNVKHTFQVGQEKTARLGSGVLALQPQGCLELAFPLALEFGPGP